MKRNFIKIDSSKNSSRSRDSCLKNFNSIDITGIANNAHIGLKYQKINQVQKGHQKIAIQNWEIGKFNRLKIKTNKPSNKKSHRHQ